MNVPTGWPDNYVLEDSLKVENKTAKRKRKEGAGGKRERENRGEKERQIRTGNIKNTSPRTQMIMFRV